MAKSGMVSTTWVSVCCGGKGSVTRFYRAIQRYGSTHTQRYEGVATMGKGLSMTVKELRNTLSNYGDSLDVYCEGNLIVGSSEEYDGEDDVEYIALERG